MIFEVNSYVGVNSIKFGMSREGVRNTLLNYEYRIFRRNSYSESSIDGYDDIGLNVSYDSSDKVEALEFSEPACVVLNGVDIFNIPASEVYALIKKLDQDVMIDEDGLISFKLGVGVYEPFYEEEYMHPIESFIVFKQGYYDSIDFG
ncbi:hypothetical protein [Acinetobacter vivianii]|uniref:hypothetical protein n=1 Tax=Acinetobacter vivianii TaxID=1776742 RepID=UPI00398A79A5